MSMLHAHAAWLCFVNMLYEDQPEMLYEDQPEMLYELHITRT
jgi:hypothetical protein